MPGHGRVRPGRPARGVEGVPVLIGTSGWHYQHWRGGFYPAGLPASKWLAHYAARFETVESNSAFYRLPEATTFAGWAAALPEGFVFALKASRYLTHIRRLKDPREPVQRMVERASHLGAKLGPVLVQLPPTLGPDPGALEEALAAFPAGMRVAVEARHAGWFSVETRGVLERAGAALCLADGGPVEVPLWRTAPWGYVRFHRGRASPDSCYGTAALRRWAERLARLWSEPEDVYVYFNNDAHGCAVRDARRFAGATARAGLRPTRVPGPRDTPLTG